LRVSVRFNPFAVHERNVPEPASFSTHVDRADSGARLTAEARHEIVRHHAARSRAAGLIVAGVAACGGSSGGGINVAVQDATATHSAHCQMFA
jgi:hypothetical protein